MYGTGLIFYLWCPAHTESRQPLCYFVVSLFSSVLPFKDQLTYLFKIPKLKVDSHNSDSTMHRCKRWAKGQCQHANKLTITLLTCKCETGIIILYHASTFHCKPYNNRYISFKTTNINLKVALYEKSGITKVIRIHPLGNMNVCTKCHFVISPWCTASQRYTNQATDQHCDLWNLTWHKIIVEPT